MTSPESTVYGVLPEGEVHEYVLTRPGAPRVALLDLGAAINGIRVDADDSGSDVCIGFTDLDQRLPAMSGYFGAVVGRYANRIADGRFELDGHTYQLSTNENGNTLHGGVDGFDKRIWSVVESSAESITFELVSPDGDQGFPGTLTARATYTLLDDGLALDLSATTDAPTVCLLTNHLYLNLAGGGTAENHLLSVEAAQYVPIDPESIPLGNLADVAGTPFDLREPTRVGDPVRSDDEQIGRAKGIDQSFQVRGEGVRPFARVEDPASGRVLELSSDQPGVQVYTGNMLTGVWVTAAGLRLRQGDAIALEPQQHPDAPNQHWSTRCVLRPGEEWTSRIEWRFSGR